MDEACSHKNMHIFKKNPDFTHRPIRIYLETSALNFMYNLNPDVNGAIATKAVHQLKGHIFYASPVLILEILLISDDELRENILNYCVHLCDNMMPKSPGELLLDNILSGGKHVSYDDFSTNSSFGKLWKNLSDLPNQTMDFNSTELKSMIDNVKKKSKYLDKLIEEFIFDGKFSDDNKSLNFLIHLVYSKINYPHPNKNVPEWHISSRKIRILIIFLIICEGAELGGDTITKYWENLNISHPFDRLMYLLQNYEHSFYSGPITFISSVISYQYHKGKTNRGAIHDGLHASYLIYFDLFFTNDKLLSEIQSEATPVYYDQYSKIRLISALEYNLRPVNISKEHPLL